MYVHTWLFLAGGYRALIPVVQWAKKKWPAAANVDVSSLTSFLSIQGTSVDPKQVGFDLDTK